ncbi:MAG: hypothetical protein GWN00_00855 [Aliifodinibius sp.]|nr:hypothetical protein [Candidatus Saccharibacteria bacterium]NIS52485.1 hypothetical protein [Phycisphaerae bacterium]NIT54827.1 hypothetical protein [Fodinibius sp.]NIV00225.1 hypothetical protein [Phycisphaerae bacterium]NIV68839.1 hypothetical protein [Phycisphaerae bacterium]
MKWFKVLVFTVMCILFGAIGACGADWYKADRASFAWEAPVTYYDGTPLPSGLTFVYEVYTKTHPGGVELAHGTVTTESATVVINEGEKVYVGASAAYIDADGVQSDFSETAWSDNPADCLDVVFGFHNLKRPGKPRNKRRN